MQLAVMLGIALVLYAIGVAITRIINRPVSYHGILPADQSESPDGAPFGNWRVLLVVAATLVGVLKLFLIPASLLLLMISSPQEESKTLVTFGLVCGLGQSL